MTEGVLNLQRAELAFSRLPASTRALWAKSGDARGHGLLAHLLDVAAVTEALLEREPKTAMAWAADAFGLAESDVVRWIATLAGLHDFGKAVSGFQQKWLDGKAIDIASGLTFPIHANGSGRHDAATAALLGPGISQATSAPTQWLRHVIQAISAHHGFHLSVDAVKAAMPRRKLPEWDSARDALLSVYWQVLQPGGIPSEVELSLAAVNWLAGLTSIADWIGSNPEWFPLGERHDRLDVYFDDAKLRARSALNSIGWASAAPLLSSPMGTAQLLNKILGSSDKSPRSLQKVGDALLQNVQGPALLLVEAPMGEGKTELALLAHLRLQAANRHRGLYMALPTQATGNAMFKRVAPFLRRFVTSSTDLQLIHGGAWLNSEMVHLRGIDHSSGEALAASEWFTQRRRPLLSPYGVGTIDQALLAVLNTKHHFVRLWGLSNRVVVLDEVHAYDTYTSGLILVLLRWLKALGSSVVLMSATLPRQRRDALLAAWGCSPQGGDEVKYPRVWLADARGVAAEPVEARAMASVHLHAIDEDILQLQQQAAIAAEAGGCVAVIVNTVDRAQTLFAALQSQFAPGTELFLFHARFPAEQRANLELDMLQAFGHGGQRPQRAILIATQVLEQSIDVDFDVMISDLAPVDLLLQRAGRLHRHSGRERPLAHQQARLYVAGLCPQRFPDLQTTNWGAVYDPCILGRTWALLRQRQVCRMPDDIDDLVQSVYDQDYPLPDDLEEAIRQYLETQAFGEYCAKDKKQKIAAANVVIDVDDEPDFAYVDKWQKSSDTEDASDITLTRLGRESVILIPVWVGSDGWSVTRDGACFDPEQPASDEVARQLYAQQLKISNQTWVGHFKSKPPVKAFDDHALLRFAHPLPLIDGRYTLDGASLTLDPLLGLVMKKAGAE